MDLEPFAGKADDSVADWEMDIRQTMTLANLDPKLWVFFSSKALKDVAKAWWKNKSAKLKDATFDEFIQALKERFKEKDRAYKILNSFENMKQDRGWDAYVALFQKYVAALGENYQPYDSWERAFFLVRANGEH